MTIKANMIATSNNVELTKVNDGNNTPNTTPLTLLVMPLIVSLLLLATCTW